MGQRFTKMSVNSSISRRSSIDMMLATRRVFALICHIIVLAGACDRVRYAHALQTATTYTRALFAKNYVGSEVRVCPSVIGVVPFTN